MGGLDPVTGNFKQECYKGQRKKCAFLISIYFISITLSSPRNKFFSLVMDTLVFLIVLGIVGAGIFLFGDWGEIAEEIGEEVVDEIEDEIEDGIEEGFEEGFEGDFEGGFEDEDGFEEDDEF